jgi:AcrR family transcriptional regulator
MPRPKKTESQLQRMREKILDAAYAILLDKGAQGLSARSIAERLGIAHMTLFTYFANQDAILQALSERELAKIQAEQEIFEQRAAKEDIVQVIRDALSFFPEFEQKNPQIYHIAWVRIIEGVEDPQLAQVRMQSNLQHLARLIQIGIERGQFEARSPLLAAAVVFSMINTPLIFWHSGRIPSPAVRDRLVREILEAALRYLKKEELLSQVAARFGPV